jgi:hypothetical protein
MSPDAIVGPVPFPLRAVAITLAVASCLGCGASEHRDILGTEKKLYSQFDEELVIRDFFQDRRGGVFLDVGASQPGDNSETTTLDKVLDDRGIQKIDFLSMDIEESEPAALAGFDIDRFRPELVCIEAVDRIQPQLLAYFEKHGYERIERYLERDAVNWYFTPKAE